MKKILLAMAALTCWGAVSASESPKMLVDGRSWLWAEFHYHYSEQYAKYYKVDVVGDEVVNGHSCKKLARYYVGQEAEKEYYTAYEKDGRIVWVGEHPAHPKLAEYPIMDFNYKKGDFVLGRVEPDGGSDEPQELDIVYRVLDEKTIEVNGTEYRELIIGDMRPDVEDPRVSWVEGIGSSHNRWQTEKFIEANAVRVEYDYLVECSQDGKVIFSRDDFSFKAELPARPKLLSEGKEWILTQHRRDIHATQGNGEISYGKYLQAQCLGPEEVDGNQRWTVRLSAIGGAYFCEDVPYIEHYVYEKDGVISNHSDGTRPLIDFRAKVGDSMEQLSAAGNEDQQSLTVTAEQLTRVGETQFRELIINDHESWVEGIGSQSDFIHLTLPVFTIEPDHCLSTDIHACYLNDKKIFGRENFSHPIQQPEYHELLNNNHEWILEETLTTPMAENPADRKKTYRCTARIDGTASIGNKECKRLVITREGSSEPLCQYYLLEEYGVLYLAMPKGDSGISLYPLLNFNVRLGDFIPTYIQDYGWDNSGYGVDTRAKTVDGKIVRELVLGQERNDGPVACWVEGVGSSTPMVLTNFVMPGSAPYSTFRMLECHRDGKVIFTANDFTYPAEASISEITHPEADAAPMFDLQGRRISAPRPGQIYIQSGRKHLAR